jgi:hypothetical protein
MIFGIVSPCRDYVVIPIVSGRKQALKSRSQRNPTGTGSNMASFAQLKKTSAKLNHPVSLAALLVKLAKNPEALTLEEITQLFQNEIRKPTKVQLGQLVQVAEQARIDYPSEKENPQVPTIKKPKRIPEPANPVETEPQPQDKEELALSPEVMGSSEAENTNGDYRAPDPEVLGPQEHFAPSDYETVSINPQSGRTIQGLIVVSESGSTKVSWTKSDASDLVYVLSGSNSSLPSTPKSAEKNFYTRADHVISHEHYLFYKLFEFSQAGSKGQQVGRYEPPTYITEFVIDAYSHEVRLSWATSAPSANVAIYKSNPNESLPGFLTAGFRLDVPNSATNFTDDQVQPGQTFEYCAVVEEEKLDGQISSELSKKEMVKIPGQVPPVNGFSVELDENQEFVNISFKKPDLEKARVRVFQIPGGPSQLLKEAKADEEEQPLERLKIEGIESWLGKEIIEDITSNDDTPEISELRRIPVRDPDKLGTITYIAVSTLGDSMLVSDFAVKHLVGSIGEVQLLDRFDYQILRTEFPKGAKYLRVYLSSPGADFPGGRNEDDQDLSEDFPRVVSREEYRRFGGVVWGDQIPGVPEVRKLPIEPKTIWVEGVANYDDKEQAGPAKSVDYSGRVEIIHKLAEVSGEDKKAVTKNSWFTKKQKESPNVEVKKLIEVQVNAPSQSSPIELTLSLTPKGLFELNDAEVISVKKVAISAVDFNTQKFVPLKSGDNPQTPIEIDKRMHEYRLQAIHTAGSGSFNRENTWIIKSFSGQEKNVQEKSKAEQKVLKIAILGAKQSGKTTYLQALLNYFEQQFSTKYDTILLPVKDSPESKSRLDALHIFIETGKLPDATARANSSGIAKAKDPRTPIQFEFGGPASPIKGVDIYDLAGDDMDSKETMELYKEQLHLVDLIIMLIDPMQNQTNASLGEGKISAPPKGTDNFIVLSNLEYVLGLDGARNPKQKLAVVVSKFDSIEVLAANKDSNLFRKIENGLSLTRDVNTNSTKRYSNQDGTILNKEVIALIKTFESGAFLNSLKESPAFQELNKRCFVVSSIGHSTDATRMDKAGITSFRVSDPILWAVDGSPDVE